MRISLFNSLYVQKLGNPIEDYEDAYCYNEASSVFAISDGATEASFSKEWAKILVENAINNPPTTAVLELVWVQEAIDKMQGIVNIDTLPWYAQNKYLEQGSFATLVILDIDKEQNQVSVKSIGDSCLFWINPDNEMSFFPIRHYEEFNNSPYLISSLMLNNISLEEKQRNIIFELQPGNTRFFLMTDSLAQWVLKECAKPRRKNKRGPFKFLEEISDINLFRKIMYQKIKKGEIRNDDLTVLIIDVIVSE
jgi:hypothetical protein